MIEQRVGLDRQSAPEQVHQQEGEVVPDVDARERVVELDGVEQRRRAVEQHDVAEMEVAVQLSHEAAGAARVQQRRVGRECGVAGRGQPIDALRWQRAGRPASARALSRRTSRMGRDRLRAGGHGTGVEGRDDVRQSSGQRAGKAAGRRHPVQQRVVGEALHHDQPFDRLACPVQRQRAGDLSSQRLDPEIRAGAVRRFRRTSDSQARRRCSSVE